jgi:hypothetical protein
VLRADREIVARLSRNRDAPRLGLVLELSMTTLLSDQYPPILFQESKNLCDFDGGAMQPVVR